MLVTLLNLWRGSQELRFLVVGGWNTLFGYLIFVGLFWLLASSLHYLAIAVVAHFLAVTQSFTAQRRLVFQSSGNWLSQYLRFNIVNLATLGGSLGLLFLLVDRCGVHVLASQAICTATVVVANYLLHQHFSFRTH